MTRLSALAALVLLVLVPASVVAHPAPFSYLDVRVEQASLDIAVVVHVLDVAHELGTTESALTDAASLPSHARAILQLVRQRLKVAVDGRDMDGGVWDAVTPAPERHALRMQVRYALATPPGRVTIAAHMFPYDPAHQTFVNVYERNSLVLQTILARDRQQVDYFAGTRQGTVAVVRRFLPSGIHHILVGPDHLLFLVGLLLLGGRLRHLILVVSAFTVAHSVTLSLAALNVVSPPAWVIEPAIALSIVYVGADNLTVRGGRDMRAWIAFGFGLIHGFGFANVLREMDLPARALGWSLFSFNLGVEVGQLVVVIAVASLLAAIRARSEAAGRRLATVGSIVVIAAGTFWFIERVFFGGGVA
jgi:hydrogenase/urease accessory protein HupE